MAVSRRVSKRAVDRNRIKRLVRESFRQQRARLPVQDILVIALPEAAKANAESLRTELAKHWQRLSDHGTPSRNHPQQQRSR